METAAICFARVRGMEDAFDAFVTELGLPPAEVRVTFGMREELDDAIATIMSDAVSNYGCDTGAAQEHAEREEWRSTLAEFWRKGVEEQWQDVERAYAKRSGR